jgi:hypothetical protein
MPNFSSWYSQVTVKDPVAIADFTIDMVCRSYLEDRELKTSRKTSTFRRCPLTHRPKDEDLTELQIQLNVLFQQPLPNAKNFRDPLVAVMKESWTKRRHRHGCSS